MSLIYGSLFTHAATELATVSFYPPELEPDVTSATKWVMLDMSMKDRELRTQDWVGEGTLTAYINTRKTTGNIYTAKDIAYNLGVAFANASIEITESAATIGYARFFGSTTNPMGEADGIIQHYWIADFFVNDTQ